VSSPEDLAPVLQYANDLTDPRSHPLMMQALPGAATTNKRNLTLITVCND